MLGLFVGLLCGAVVAAVYMLFRSPDYCSELRWVDWVVFAVILAVGCWLGCVVERETNRAYIAEYQAAKYTIEANLKNEEMSDLTRMELLKEATEYNVALAGKQYSAERWYGFNIPEEVLDLDPINLGG